MFKDVETICPFCGVGCRIVLRVNDQHHIEGVYPSDKGVNQGKLCIKGWSAHEFIEHNDRLKQPLLREDRSKPFRTVSWDEALNWIRGSLLHVLEKHGPHAVSLIGSAKCSNEDNYALQKFGRAVAKTPNIDNCARLCHASTMTGLTAAFGSGAMTNSIEEMEDADVLLIIGSNTTEQHPLISRRILRAIRDNDRTLILIDPRRIDLAGCSHIYLQSYPGSDVALINGFIHIILKERMEDRDFIIKRVEGFDELAKSIIDYTPESVSKITGVPSKEVVQAARLIGHAKRVSIVYAMGVTQHATGTDTVLALTNLALITGNVGRRSTGVNPLRGQNNVQGTCDVGCLPDVFPGYQGVSEPSIQKFFQKTWSTTQLPREAGLTMCEMFNGILDGKIHWMYIMGENPALSMPNSLQISQALEQLDLLVVHDIFLNETASFAHVVLPGASFAEKDGTFTSTERRVQMVHKAIKPLGRAKQEWKAIGELARRMGYNGMNWRTSQQVFREISQVTPIYRGMSYNCLGDHGIQWPCPEVGHPGTPFLHKEQFSRGKGLLVPVHYNPPPEVPDKHYPMVLVTGRTLFHFHTGTMTRRSPTLQALLDEAYIEINPRDASLLEVQEGQIIKVQSRRGFINVKAHIKETIPRNILFIPIHFAEASANVLTMQELDTKSGIPELKICAVRVEP